MKYNSTVSFYAKNLFIISLILYVYRPLKYPRGGGGTTEYLYYVFLRLILYGFHSNQR